jgi:hypothetical protein
MKGLLGPDALARRRLRRSAEVLTEDSSLRSNLTDEQAQQLLDWGMARVRESVTATISLSDTEAYPILERRVAVVRRIMRLLSRLMTSPSSRSQSDTNEYLSRLLDGLQQLAGRPGNRALLSQAKLLGGSLSLVDRDSTFQLLMELVQLDSDLDEEE